MIRLTDILPATISFTLLASSQVEASEPREPGHNPFARPPSERTVRSAPRDQNDGSVQALDLRATMVGSTGSLANVAGRTLRPGDEIDGYILLEVYEDRALFSRQGKQEIIHVKPDPVEDDE